MRRFRLRTLMVAIAAVALLLGVGFAAVRLEARCSAFRAKASEFASREALFAKHVESVIRMAGETERADWECTEQSRLCSGMDRLKCLASVALFRSETAKHKAQIDRYQARADWFAMMKDRYQYAASHPWLSVPPDPLEPR